MPTVQLNIILGFSYFVIAVLTEWWADTLAVWPAAGFLLAAMMVYGNKVWWGIWLGSFAGVLMHFTQFEDVMPSQLLSVAFLTATGNILGALIATKFLPAHFFNWEFSEAFHIRAGRYLAAAFSLGFIAALFGISSYHFLYSPIQVGFLNGVIGWAISDIVGVIVISPLCYLLYNHRHKIERNNLSCEGGIILLSTLLVSYFISGPGFHISSAAFLQPSLLIIPLIWAVLRLSPVEVAILNFLTFMMAWWGTSTGHGYFFAFFDNGGLTAMQVVLCFTLLSIQLMKMLLVQMRCKFIHQNELLEAQVTKRTQALEEAKREAEMLARTDSLTGLNNRRAFFLTARQTEKASQRHQRIFSVLMLDIDHFKRINDTYGHDVGDKVIIALAQCIDATVRDVDITARIGGEEFAILAPETSTAASFALAERLHTSIQNLVIPNDNQTLQITVSIGVATQTIAADSLDTLLKQADQALYSAKNEGRNRIKVFSSEPY